MISFLLLLVGLFLVLLEFYLPGVVMGLMGGGFILASVLLFISEDHGWIATLLFIAGIGAALILLVRFALWRIVQAKPGRSIYLSQDQEGYRASSYDEQAIGKVGKVLSDLKPGGYILIGEKPLQAISLDGYLKKGEKVIVVSGQEDSLMVRKFKD